jgi:hypothetical protein
VNLFDHPALVDLWLAPPGTPVPGGATEPLHPDFADAGSVRGPELLDEHGLGGSVNPFPLTWVRLVRDILARVRVGDPWSMVAQAVDPSGYLIRGVLPYVRIVDVQGRTAWAHAYPLFTTPPVRWFYTHTADLIGATA